MNADIPKLSVQRLPVFNTVLPIHLYFLKNLGSATHPDCRMLVRQKLFELLSAEGHIPSPSLLALDHRPQHDTLNISLSHGHHHSLIGWTPTKLKIGVDIESLDRLTSKIVERVSTAEELASAPDPQYIWSAKEAAFKACYPRHNVVSFVEVVDWTLAKKNHWTFAVGPKNHSEGYGELCLIERHSIAFFTLPT
jgi:4'-phosphopantetheinyl transferase EntD